MSKLAKPRDPAPPLPAEYSVKIAHERALSWAYVERRDYDLVGLLRADPELGIRELARLLTGAKRAEALKSRLATAIAIIDAIRARESLGEDMP